MGANQQVRTVKSVETACGIIGALRELDGAGVTELSTHLDMAKGTVHCHLTTLREQGFVCKDHDAYRLSLRFLELGEYARNDIEVLDVVRPELADLAEDHDARTQFVVEEHGQGVFVSHHVAESSHMRLAPIQTGGRFSLHCTASGKAIMAFLPQQRIDDIVSTHGLNQPTENTIADYETLTAELEEIRERGVAFNDGENRPGLRAVGAPIHGPDDRPLGSISISMPASRMKDDRFYEEIPEAVKDTANVIEVNARIQLNTAQ